MSDKPKAPQIFKPEIFSGYGFHQSDKNVIAGAAQAKFEKWYEEHHLPCNQGVGF